MCCLGGACMTLCTASGGGYCSECVGAAACNPALCGSCITGNVQAPTECVAPGSCVGINGNPCITPCLIPNSNIPCCAVHQTSPCLPCSPTQCGVTDPAPYCNPDACIKSSPVGGGSGAGSAPSAGGGKSGGGGASACTSKLSQAMNKLGATLAGLLTGGKRVPVVSTIPGQAAPKPLGGISHNTFFLVLVIGGLFLLFFAFGHAPEGD